MYQQANCVALIAAAAACNNKRPCVTVSHVLEILQSYHIVQKSLQTHAVTLQLLKAVDI